MKNLKPQDKIKIAIEIVEPLHVFDVLIRFLTFKSVDRWDDFTIQESGDIYDEETGRYLNEAELDEFIEYARNLAK